MRSIVLLLAAGLLSAESQAPDFRQFDEALQTSHLIEAAGIVDKLLEQRIPADGKPRQDPLLNALIGRLSLAAHEEGAAAVYLAHADLKDLPVQIRAETALAHGRALELQGDRHAAALAYADAASTALNDTQHRLAALGTARQQVVSDPAAVRQNLLSIANGPTVPERWEARYLISLASSLLGDPQSAARFADQAWADSAAALPNHLAPLHVGTLRAGLAAARHDRLAERAMLTTTHGLSVGATGSLGAQLPVCGDDGIQPSDFVIFGIVTGPYYTRDLIPIAASRLAVVAPFYDRFAGRGLTKLTDSNAPVGTVVTVACRSVVHPDFVSKAAPKDALLDWLVERGLYPASARSDADDESVNAIAAKIESLESRFGKASVLLIEPRLQLMTQLETRARAGDQIPAGQLTDLRRDVAAGLRRAGAPDWMIQTLDSRNEYEQLRATTSDPAEQMSAFESLFRKQLLSAPFEMVHAFVAQMLNNIDGDPPAPIARMVVALDANKPKTFAGRDRQAWALTVARSQHVLGLDKEARANIASSGLDKDLCAVADEAPKLLEQHFSYDDYPEDLVAGEQEGSVLFEFTVAPSGEVRSPRIVYSIPSGLFDEPSAKGIGTVRYTAPTRGGKPSACRGQTQSLIWRLENQTDVWVPSIEPPTPDETT